MTMPTISKQRRKIARLLAIRIAGRWLGWRMAEYNLCLLMSLSDRESSHPMAVKLGA
jgi:hypothetical protein